MLNEINFIFCIGFRCYSVEFLKKYELRKISGPFDYLFIDIETSFKILNNNFNNFLYDIVLFNKSTKNIKLYYNKNTNEINNNLYKLLKKRNIFYMAHNYNYNNLLINQNYINNNLLSNNLYDWTNICVFLHHNIVDNNIYNIIKMRCERFINISNIYKDNICLFFITKIISCNNIKDYIKDIINMKNNYNIYYYLIIIICSDNNDEEHYYYDNEKCLFIIKKVDSYEYQYTNYKTDNNLNYDKEYEIILKYFKFNLIEKSNI